MVTLIHPRLEYTAVMSSPNEAKDTRKIERIRRAAQTMVPNLMDLPYKERLERLGQPIWKKGGEETG